MPNSFRELVRRPLELLICLMFLAMVVVTFAQVVSRYVLHESLSWSEETARFLLIWLGMVCAGYAFKFRSHFSLRFVVERFPKTLQRLIAILVDFAMIAFLILFIYESYQYLAQSVSGMTAPALGIPMVIPYSATLFGGLIMLYYVSKNAWQDLISGPSVSNKTQADTPSAESDEDGATS